MSPEGEEGYLAAWKEGLPRAPSARAADLPALGRGHQDGRGCQDGQDDRGHQDGAAIKMAAAVMTPWPSS